MNSSHGTSQRRLGFDIIEGAYVEPRDKGNIRQVTLDLNDKISALKVPKFVRFRLDKAVEEIDNVGKLDELICERHPFQSL